MGLGAILFFRSAIWRNDFTKCLGLVCKIIAFGLLLGNDCAGLGMAKDGTIGAWQDDG
jgi:hypothetical protein